MSAHWLKVWREEHAVAFTVAQMTDLDLLADTHKALTRALRQGQTYEAFRAGLEPWLRARGWKPHGRGGGVGKRLRRIFDTNLRSSRAAGRWDRIERTAKLLPWLLYTLGPSRVHRPDHQEWAGVCLRHDDPWWTTHYPPNGWGCKCSVRQLAEPPAGAQTTAPQVETREWTDKRTGEIRQALEGIDPGWDFNAGQRRTVGVNGALVRRLEGILAGDGRLLQGASAAARERLTRRVVGRHVAGPGFRWFVERPRPGGGGPEWQARDARIEATPVAVPTDQLSRRIGARRLLRVTEPMADKQWRRHGPHKRRPSRRTPIDWWGDVQRLVDGIEPSRNAKGYWEFADVAGKRLLSVAVDKEGAPFVVTYHRRASLK